MCPSSSINHNQSQVPSITADSSSFHRLQNIYREQKKNNMSKSLFQKLPTDEDDNSNKNNVSADTISNNDATETIYICSDKPSKLRRTLLVCTYIISMLSINSLPAVYNPMISENILTAATATQVVGFESYGIAFGKLCFGASSDMFG